MTTNNEDWSQLSDEELASREAEAVIEDDLAGADADDDAQTDQNDISSEQDNTDDAELDNAELDNADADNEQSAENEDDAAAIDTAPKVEEVDYRAAYEKLTSPFKANGRETKVDTVEEAIQMMQMGVNYHKNMGEIKQHKKIVKLLERNQLLDSEKLSFLIDLNNKNPQAIAKLIADGSIDPMDIDTENAQEYKPTQHDITDGELYFEEVVNSLKEDPAFSKVASLVLEQWDNASRNVILQNPDLMRPLTAQMGSGVYETIMGHVEKQRMLGNLTNMSDLAAYKQIGDQLANSGVLDSKSSARVVSQKPKVSTNANRQRAAAPSNRNSTNAPPKEVTELAKMDDEAFLKHIQSQ